MPKRPDRKPYRKPKRKLTPEQAKKARAARRLTKKVEGRVEVDYEPTMEEDGDEDSGGHLYSVWVPQEIHHPDYTGLDDRDPAPLPDLLAAFLRRLADYLNQTADMAESRPRRKKKP